MLFYKIFIFSANVEVMEKGHNSPSINSVKSKEPGPIRVQSSLKAHSPLRIPSPIRIISPLKIHKPLRVRVRDDLFSTAGKFKLCYYTYYIFIIIMVL